MNLEETRPAQNTLLDAILPQYDIRAHYQLLTPGSPTSAFRAIKELTGAIPRNDAFARREWHHSLT